MPFLAHGRVCEICYVIDYDNTEGEGAKDDKN